MSELLGKELKPSLVKSLLRRNGFRWKRMRNSLKSERDEVLFEFFKSELQALKQLASEGQIDLYYLDETGLNLNPNVPYAWQKLNTTALLPAQRADAKTIVGMFSPIKQDLRAALFDGAVDARCIRAFIDHFAEKLPEQTNRKTIVVLDQATIHTAGIIKERFNAWQKKGLYLQFLPAYCSELNLIEILWKHLKHFWIKAEDYASIDTLTKAAKGILKQYGKYYTISFL